MEDNQKQSLFDYTLFITGQCNSNCVMCPSPDSTRRNGVVRSVEDLLAEVECIPDDTEHITVTGGEPTLIGNGFFKIMQALNTRFPDMPVLYLTNARAFSVPSFGQAFAEQAKNIDTVAVPIHAHSAEAHDLITRSEGSFVQTIGGLKTLASSRANIEIRIVVSNLNLNELLETVNIVLRDAPRVNVLNFIALEMTGNAARNKADVWVGYREAFDAVKPCIQTLLEHGITVHLYNWPLCTVKRSHWNLVQKSISDYKVRFEGVCMECMAKELCGGQFAANAVGGYDSLSPIGVES